MKKLTLSLFVILLFSGFTPEKFSSSVYICTGPKANVYHLTNTCKGMNRCSGDIVGVSWEKLRNQEKSL
jgi:hypothetical protein